MLPVTGVGCDTSTMTEQDRQAIIVLGMHRSGTSALAGTLAKLGVRLPARLLAENEYNPKGYFEPEHIVAIHDRLLAAAGLSWSSIAGLPEAWYGSAEACAYAGELAAAVREDYGDAALYVVKDPRMCRLMPLWRMVLDEVGAQSRFVIALRHPFEVARSLETRDGLPLAHGYLLWLCHMLAAERETRGARRVFVHFDALLSDPTRVATDIVAQLVGDGLAPAEDSAREIAALVDSDLRHQIANPGELHHSAALSPWLSDAYDALAALVGRPTDTQAMQELDKVGAALNPAIALFAPLLAASGEKIAGLAKAAADKDARLLQHQDQIAALSGAVAALEGTVTELKTTVAAQAEQAANLGRTIETYKTEIDALNAQAEEIFQSTGWRLLAPLRWYGRQRERLRRSRRRQ